MQISIDRPVTMDKIREAEVSIGEYISSLAQRIQNNSSSAILGLIIGLLFIMTKYLYASKTAHQVTTAPVKLLFSKADGGVTLLDFEALGKIMPLNDFRWQDEAPRKWRPFKPIYNMTMALSRSSLNDLIVIDRNHLSRTDQRRQIIAQHPGTVIGHLPSEAVTGAVSELYSLLTSLLPVRYPSIFTISVDGGALQNGIDGSSIPISPLKDPGKALEAIGRTLDEDFLILLPSEDGDGYTLQAYIACFPAGFDTSKLIGKKIRDIHGPVPGYKEKLRVSMERFFERVEVGRFVRRVNWGVVTRPDLFTAFIQSHFHIGDEMKEEEEVDLEKTFQRTEAQQLFRLPGSRALVFMIKTYLYSLNELKDEGSGGEFADAIEGLDKGNVPEIGVYKRAPVWKEKVVEYLRS